MRLWFSGTDWPTFCPYSFLYIEGTAWHFVALIFIFLSSYYRPYVMLLYRKTPVLSYYFKLLTPSFLLHLYSVEGAFSSFVSDLTATLLVSGSQNEPHPVHSVKWLAQERTFEHSRHWNPAQSSISLDPVAATKITQAWKTLIKWW